MDKKSKKHKKIKYPGTFGLEAEKDYLIEQLSLLLSSGMNTASAISAIREEMKSKSMKKILDIMLDNINSGMSLAATLNEANIFPKHIVSLIKIGEKSGKLSENLKVVAINQQKDRDFKSKVVSAMMYPVFVFGLTIAIGIGIAWFILPNLAKVFGSLKIELPIITKILIGFGKFLGEYGAIFVPSVIVLGFFLVFIFFIFPKTNFLGQYLLFFIKPVRKLLVEAELARFGYVFGNLLLAGLPIVDALLSIQNATLLYKYKKFYKHLTERIEEGSSFQKSFKAYKKSNDLLPYSMQQLIVASELSGSLPETFIKIGKIYEEKTENTTKNLTVLLEPILLVIVWLGVVTVALAVILPLYSLIGGLNSGQ
jgi:type IV pilus assembly protein PilC